MMLALSGTLLTNLYSKTLLKIPHMIFNILKTYLGFTQKRWKLVKTDLKNLAIHLNVDFDNSEVVNKYK